MLADERGQFPDSKKKFEREAVHQLWKKLFDDKQATFSFLTLFAFCRAFVLKALARAGQWFEEVASGRVPSLTAIARREHLAKRYVARRTKLAFVAPLNCRRIVERSCAS